MLLSRIALPAPDSPEPEDIFVSALTTIFTDDTVNSHGTPGGYITYRSPRYGELKLRIPAHPDVEEGRKLFAHYLWNAGVLAADAIECASAAEGHSCEEVRGHGTGGESEFWDRRYWGVRGKRTLELGAATALPSLLAALSNAASVTITDHPSSPALVTNAIEENLKLSLSHPPSTFPPNSSPTQATSQFPRSPSDISIYGYTWGTSTFYLPNGYGKPSNPSGQRYFDRIIIADCLWMPSQHLNLIKTILEFLPPKLESNTASDEVELSGDGDDSPCALVVADFHTGRRIVRDFFSLATGHVHSDDDTEDAATPTEAGEATASVPDLSSISRDDERQNVGKLRLLSIFEMTASYEKRAWTWSATRQGETKWDMKRWCVVGILARE